MSKLVEDIRYANEHGLFVAIKAGKNPSLQAAADRIEALESALCVGKTFLDKCNSAWSCGEPSHRVRAMLDAADDFRAALNRLEENASQ